MENLDALEQRPTLAPTLRLQVAMFAAVCRADDAVLTESARRLEACMGDAADFATACREICLQGIAYCGFPRALHALFLLDVPALPEAASAQRAHTVTDPLERGRAHFESIYGSSASKLRAKIHELDPVFEALVIEVAYGRLLARDGLDAKTRELLGVAGLSVLGHATQMLSHAFGARRHGARIEEVLEAVDAVSVLWPEIARAKHREFLSERLGD